MTQNLSDADDREVFGVDNDLATRCPHALAARAEKFNRPGLRRGGRIRPPSGAKLRSPPPQRFNQLRAIHFARGLTGRDQNLHAAIVLEPGEGRSNPSAKTPKCPKCG